MKKFLSVTAAALALTTISACKPQPANQADIEKILKEYILAHPEVLVQSLESYQQKSAEADNKKAEEALKARHADIFENPNSPVLGNPNGKIVVVEFFDYNCGYCKRVLPDLKKLMDENKDVKVIMKELPILGPTSGSAAIAALIIHDIAPEKYFTFHSAIMSHQGPVDDAAIAAAITKAGLDPVQVKDKFKDKKYADILAKNTDIAQSLNVSGTPTFIINGKIVRGAIRYDAMKELTSGAPAQ